MSDHDASDLVTIVRSQRATVEALNRVVHMRARIRSTIAAIDRAEEQIQQMRLLLDRERADAREPSIEVYATHRGERSDGHGKCSDT